MKFQKFARATFRKITCGFFYQSLRSEFHIGAILELFGCKMSSGNLLNRLPESHATALEFFCPCVELMCWTEGVCLELRGTRKKNPEKILYLAKRKNIR